MTRRAILLRSWLLMLGLLGVTALVSPNVARAQDPCKCDYIDVYVGDDVKCKFEVCVKDAEGFFCEWVGPGSHVQFKCHDNAAVFLTDCKGNYVQVTEKCVECVCLAPGCCVDACLARDDNGCLYVKIWQSQCKCPL